MSGLLVIETEKNTRLNQDKKEKKKKKKKKKKKIEHVYPPG